MKSVAIQDLKRKLSAILAEVERGETVLVTRHGQPAVRLSAASAPSHCWTGPMFGKSRLGPPTAHGLGGRALEILDDGRRERLDDLI